MAAPTVKLAIVQPTATRMAPHAIHASLDWGKSELSLVNEDFTWEDQNGTTDLEIQINAANLDAHELQDDTAFDAADNNIKIDPDGSSASDRYVAELIFPNVTIPTGKEIIFAHLEVYARHATPEMDIYGEDVDDAADFSTNADIVNRTKTSASVRWDENLTANAWQQSEDFAEVVQEIYDRQGELDGVNVGIILQGASDLGTLPYWLRSYDFDPALAAKLIIKYADSPATYEYKLDTPLADLADSGETPTDGIVVNENGSPMSEGTVGSLAAGEYGISGGELYVRLTDSSDPNDAADDFLDISFDGSLTGNSDTRESLRIMWQIAGVGASSVDDIPSKYRHTTDPRSWMSSRQVDLTGQETTYNSKSYFNRPRGFGMNWVVPAGTWQVSCTVINTDRESTTETSSTITVAENTRTEVTVQASGGDYTTVASAFGAVGATENIELVVEDGHTEDASSDLTQWTGANLYMRQAGSGTKPEITWDGVADGVEMMQLAGESFFIESIDTDCNATGSGSRICWSMKNRGGFANCRVKGDISGQWGDPWLVTLPTDGILILNCVVDRCYRYAFGGATSGLAYFKNISVIGCDFGIASNESVIRTVGSPVNYNALWNDLTGNQNKSCLRFTSLENLHAFGNKWHDGDNWGGIPGPEGPGVRYVRIEGNEATGEVSAAELILGVRAGVEDALACNNYSAGPGRTIFTTGNYGGATTGNPNCKRIKFFHNTTLAESGNAGLFVTGGTNNGTDDHEDNRVEGNVFATEVNTDASGYWVDIGDVAADVRDNVFPATAPNLADFARIYVAGVVDRTQSTLANFNAESFASGNIEDDVSLDSNYYDSGLSNITTKPGVYDDLWGYPRGATSLPGAVGDDPGSSAPTVDSATINAAGTQATFVHSEAVTDGDDDDDYSGYSVSGYTLSNGSGLGTDTITFDITQVWSDETPTLDYDSGTGSIESVATSEALATISGGSITNNSTVDPEPVVTADNVTNISFTTADAEGSLVSEGREAVSGVGVVWGTSPNPTGNFTPGMLSIGLILTELTGLPDNQLIYWRIRAENASGFGYSDDATFTTLDDPAPTVIDVRFAEGNTRIQVTYSEACDNHIGYSTDDGTITHASGDGTPVHLFSFTGSPTELSYTPGDVVDSLGQALAAFSGRAILPEQSDASGVQQTLPTITPATLATVLTTVEP